jgi:hypothetical protein
MLNQFTYTPEKITIVDFLEEVLLDGFLDTLKLIPFLFLTYLLMEFIEHRASDKALGFMKKSGNLGPLVGGAFGIAPQCAFSAVAANLYTGRVITLGTMLAVFLSTSDEMLPILIAENAQPKKILIILGYKAAVAIVMGFAVDILLRLLGRGKREINIDEICENDNCHCERGILHSAIHHTVTISIFVFVITLVLNSLIFFIGTERLSYLGDAAPVLSHLIFAILGLIPGCATSVAIATLGMNGIISTGAMLSGLFTGAGVGNIILWRLNSNKKENLFIMLTLVAIGFLFGFLADVIGISV